MTLLTLELRLGSTHRVPLHLRHHGDEQLAQALVAADQMGGGVPLENTPFALCTALACAAEGNAAFQLCAEAPLGRGRVRPGARLYFGATALELATAPLAWRCVLQQYYSHMGANGTATLLTFGAPGPMPRTLPWAAGFLTAESSRLTADERTQLLTAVSLVGLAAWRHCDRAHRKAVAAGEEFTLDAERFPELDRSGD